MAISFHIIPGGGGGWGGGGGNYFFNYPDLFF
jgi:hypothetical protein